MSIVRALSFNGLANAFHIAAINGGRHVAPTFAGDTIYAWSEVLERVALPARRDVAALRVRTIGLKNVGAAAFPCMTPEEKYLDSVVADLDMWLIAPTSSRT